MIAFWNLNLQNLIFLSAEKINKALSHGNTGRDQHDPQLIKLNNNF